MDSQNNQAQAGSEGQAPTQNTTEQASQSSSAQNNSNQNQAPQATPVSNHTVLALISYIGPLVIISYLMGKDNDFVKFHAGQGLVVFGLEVLVWILGSMMMYSFGMIVSLLNLATLILSIIGIVNVLQGHKKELPLIGGLAKSFNL